MVMLERMSWLTVNASQLSINRYKHVFRNRGHASYILKNIRMLQFKYVILKKSVRLNHFL